MLLSVMRWSGAAGIRLAKLAWVPCPEAAGLSQGERCRGKVRGSIQIGYSQQPDEGFLRSVGTGASI